MNSPGLTKIILFILAGKFLITSGKSLCCPYIEWILYHPAPGTNCHSISGGFNYDVSKRICAYVTCADLEDHNDRFYCGTGTCDFFGCNCDGGCIQLDEWSKAQVATYENHTTVHIRDLFFVKHRELIEGLYMEDSDPESLQKLSSTKPIGFEIY